MRNTMWPTSYTETASGWQSDGVFIKPEHILDYAYPPGNRKRYTLAGWDVWKQIAIREGIAIPIERL